MGEQSNSKNRSRNAAHRQSENHFTPDCALVQMHPSRRYFREEIEQSVRTDGYDGGNSQTENQYGEQENAAPQSSQSDQSAHEKADEDFDRDQRHSGSCEICGILRSRLFLVYFSVHPDEA